MINLVSVQYSPYRLFPRAPLNSRCSQNPREGVLLKIDFGNGKVGYSDCFPWVEFGDLPWKEQVAQLQAGLITSLTERALFFAQLDAEARVKKKSLFESISVPPSHDLLTKVEPIDERFLEKMAHSGFQKIKLKCGSNLLEEASWIQAMLNDLKAYSIKLRLDFNSSVAPSQLDYFLDLLGPSLSVIDFIEDPLVWDIQLWAAVKKKWGVRLALDWISLTEIRKIEKPSFSVLVLKPARQDPELWLREAERLGVSVVVTSSLDHPFGQVCAAWTAGKIQQEKKVILESCGLVSHLVYEPHPFSETLRVEFGALRPSVGEGFGMTALFEGLDWNKAEFLKI